MARACNHQGLVRAAQEHAGRDGGGAGPPPAPNPLLMGQTPEAAVLKALAGVRANELEQALLLLPYTDALRLLTYLCHWLRKGLQVRYVHTHGSGRGCKLR